eukprot:CAMPEP_0194544196 /NCGR_PEP_ID=MMETSP0253-20130528/87124_1 /TAXON_ID=2966 /ORGANISM="Noctiluca scintillans" /LENGTH=429 /DNA_ID=CAMNT_0039391049 /DNA_START=102 /DNA_END=1391 /DNA_ORIENTATION=-
MGQCPPRQHQQLVETPDTIQQVQFGSEQEAPLEGEQSQPTPRGPEKTLVETFRAALLTDTFWKCFEADPHVVSGTSCQFKDLIQVDALVEALLWSSDSQATVAFKHGEPYHRENVFLAYLDHAALCLNESEHYFPSIMDLCQDLAKTFDFVTARLNVYPPLPIPPSTLDTDVVLVQLWGVQRVIVSPAVGLRVSQPRPEPLLMSTMSPGDAIYVPRGLQIRQQTPDGGASRPTLTLALSLRTREQSLGVSLSMHITDLLRENLPQEVDHFCRSAITKPLLQDSATDDGALEAKLMTAAKEIASRVNMASTQKHYEERMETLRQAQREGAARVAELAAGDLPVPRIVATTRMRVVLGVVCQCQPGSTVAHFRRGSASLALPIGRTASQLIHELSDGEAHVVGSLTCADPIERLCVCQVLLFKECLEIVKD